MRDQEKICREEWFKDHEAKLILGPPKGDVLVTIIEWQNPKSWNYGCRFIIYRQWLCVVGDMGEAVYQWGQDVDLKFLATLNFDYFMGKCRASPSGRRFRQWDHQLLKERIEEWRKRNRDIELEADSAFSYADFQFILHDAINEGEVELEEASELSEMGYIPNVMCIGHFVGLQMAIKQLTPPTT